MKIKGQLNQCDRCGDMMFQEVKLERETDGGYTRWTEFIEPGENGRYYLIHLHGQTMWVCPRCYEEYEARLKDMEKAYINATSQGNRPLKMILRKDNDNEQLTNDN